MRVAQMLVAAFSPFFLKRKDTEGSRESGSDAGGTCRGVRREGKKGGGEERKGHGKRAAGARTYLRGQRRWPARCARARRAALCRERAASSVKHVNHRFRCALAFYRPRASPISRQQSCCAAYACLCSCDPRPSVTRLSEGLPILSSHHSDALGRHRIVAIFYSPNGQHSHHLV